MFENCKNKDQLDEAILKFIKDKKKEYEALPPMLKLAIWKGRVHYAQESNNWAKILEEYDHPPNKNYDNYKQAYLDACTKLVELGEQLPQIETDPFMGLLRIAGEPPTETSEQQPATNGTKKKLPRGRPKEYTDAELERMKKRFDVLVGQGKQNSEALSMVGKEHSRTPNAVKIALRRYQINQNKKQK